MQQNVIESLIGEKMHFNNASYKDKIENKVSVNQQGIISYIVIHYEMKLSTTELPFCTEAEQMKRFSL